MKTRVLLSILTTAAATIYFGSTGHADAPRVTTPAARAEATSVDVAAPAIDVAGARRDFFDANPGSDLFERGDRITRVYGRAFSQGRGASESAGAFIAQHSDIFGVAADQILPMGAFPDGSHAVDVYWDENLDGFRFTLLGYSQFVQGVPVFRSSLKLLMRNEAGYPLVLASVDLRNIGAFATTLVARPSLADFNERTWSGQAIRLAAIAQPTEAQLVIFAGADDSPATPTLAVSFIVERGVPGAGLSKMLYVTEATTGKVLFEEEQICNIDITGSVQGLATTGWAADACAAEAAAVVPYAAVSSGATTVYADANGAFTFPNAGTGSLSLTSNLFVGGRYFKVDNVAGSELTLTTVGGSGGTANFLHNAGNLTEQDRAQVNAYLHSNICRDYIIAANPTYPTISTQQGATAFQINVGVAGTCNAFYNGPSINFYSSGGGCNNTAFATVVHHELGHHMVAAGGSGQGAYGEGMGDVVGALISETSSLAIGFQTCATGIRNAANTCQFDAAGCSSCGSAIHACGQLLSGCFWDARLNLLATTPATYRTLLRNIAVNSVLLHTGTTIASDITLDVLTLDDDNSDIGDGSPHYTELNSAFTVHGLPGPTVQPLKFTFPNGIPPYSTPNTSMSIAVQVSALGAQPQPNTGKVYWRTGTGAYSSAAMTQGVANSYTTSIPVPACGTSVQYYFEAKTTANAIVLSPSTAPTTVHSTAGGYGESVVMSDQFEVASGWTAGVTGDTATTGIWTRVDPIGTAAQPENDHTAAGALCYITGQGTAGGALGEADIDGGATTLLSPSFSLVNDPSASVSYWRWYSNDTGGSPNADSMAIQISNNGGTSWVQLELVTENLNVWVAKSFRVSDFVTPTATMRVRFVASDTGTGSLVEAGVDDFAIAGISCTPPFVPADLNQDGSVNGQDLAILLSGWATVAGDITGDGTTDGADLAVLLSAWSG